MCDGTSWLQERCALKMVKPHCTVRTPSCSIPTSVNKHKQKTTEDKHIPIDAMMRESKASTHELCEKKPSTLHGANPPTAYTCTAHSIQVQIAVSSISFPANAFLMIARLKTGNECPRIVTARLPP